MTIRHLLDNTPLLRIALAFALGVVVGDAWGAAVPPWAWLAVAAVAITMAMADHGRHTALQGAAIMVATLCLATALTVRHERLLALPPTAQPHDWRAIITDEPQERGRTLRCDLLVTEHEGQSLPRPIKVRASLLKDTATHRWQRLHAGDGLAFTATLTPPRAYRASSRFDYVRWMQVHGFAAQAFAHHRHWQKVAVPTAPLSRLDRVRLKATRLRTRLVARYHRLGLDEEQLAVVAAMTLGDRRLLPQTLRDDYAVSGAAHVLALSGLHLGIIYAVLTLLLGGGRRWRWLSQSTVLAAIWTYTVLVGLPASAVRAATMLSVYGLCVAVGRQRASVNALALAALVMLAANPLTLWDVGFQMSFMAVLAIVAYAPALLRLLPLQNPIVRWLWGLTAVSLAAQLGTAPLVAYYFGRFSSYFLLTNLIAIPAATLILYGAVVLLLATPLPALQQWLAAVMATLAQWLNTALARLAHLPGASIEGIRLSTAQLYLIYIVLLSLTVIVHYALKIRRQRRLDAFY